MLIYLIPLVILIIVLLLVKKRQDAQGSAKAKPTVKKGAASSNKAPLKTKAAEEPVAIKKSATPLTADVRQKIESLISKGNYFSAEAQINQALNRDNSQHELYLLLLDIHTKQKDDFAISQLINHIRSLGLDEILEQAEAQKAEYEKSSLSSNDSIEFHSSNTKSTQTAPIVAEVEEAPHIADDTAFDVLQADAKPTKSVFEVKPSQNDIQPLEFNFEPSFTKTEPVAEKPVEEQPIFESNFDFTPSAPIVESVESPIVDTAPTLEFDIASLKTEEPAILETTEDIKPLDFSFSLDNSSTASKVEDSVAINLDITNIQIVSNEVVTAPITENSPFDFKLDSVSEKVEQPITDFSFNTIAPPIFTTDKNDPLVQSFPELMETDEITLNLELADQYIKLGAYDAARELLAEKDARYSSAQRQQADQLLNQIAS